MRQGTKANFTGSQLENVIDGNIQSKGYQFVSIKDFDKARYLEQPIYTRQYPLCESIYSSKVRCDFLLYHPEKYPECLVIESKWQQSGGSVDEKYPYLVLNIKEKYPHATIVVLDGGGYKKEAESWLRRQVDKKLIHIFNMMEFQKWVNSNKL